MTEILPTLFEIGEKHGITNADYSIAARYVGSDRRLADMVIAPDGEPYLYRWHVVPQNKKANVYFHIQVKSDPERPLHDHPWDNQSVILAGGYNEIMERYTFVRIKGDVVTRVASQAHRLLMPEGVPYTMTLFTTGPKVRRWGFWYPEGWVDADEVCRLDGRVSTHVRKED